MEDVWIDNVLSLVPEAIKVSFTQYYLFIQTWILKYENWSLITYLNIISQFCWHV